MKITLNCVAVFVVLGGFAAIAQAQPANDPPDYPDYWEVDFNNPAEFLTVLAGGSRDTPGVASGTSADINIQTATFKFNWRGGIIPPPDSVLLTQDYSVSGSGTGTYQGANVDLEAIGSSALNAYAYVDAVWKAGINGGEIDPGSKQAVAYTGQDDKRPVYGSGSYYSSAPGALTVTALAKHSLKSSWEVVASGSSIYRAGIFMSSTVSIHN